jgi:hypothetical protein
MKHYYAFSLFALLTFSLAAPTENLTAIDIDTGDAQNTTCLDPLDTCIAQKPPLGPNCKGSITCIGFSPRGTKILRVSKALGSFITAIPDYKKTNSGQHIACVKGTLGWYGGICAYFQNIKEQANGAQAKELVKHVIELGCKTFGSYPTDGKLVKNGELTINFVEKPACHGTCV